MSKASKRTRPKPASQEKRETPASSNATPRLSKYELSVVACLFLVGVGFRCAYPSRMSVEHFDEGVYASNIWFGAELGYHYPQLRLYAPPLLPSLIESSIIAENIRSPSSLQPSSLAVMAPSLLAGCLTLLAVWWTARDWFGPPIGLGALTLAGLCDLHSLYSRTALTEALLVLFLLLSLWAMRRALSDGGFGIVVIAGLLTGLAWWTKYNGWLPLAIGFAAIVISCVVERGQQKQLGRAVGCWAGIAVSAVLIWSPYLWRLQESGGYAVIAANHKQYVVGLSGWIPSLLRQYANLTHYDGLASCCGIALTVIVVASASPYEASISLLRRRPAQCCSLALILAALAAWIGAAAVLFVLALVFVIDQLRGAWSAAESQDLRHRFAWQLSAAWVVGLFFAIPLYHPYPRLTLPWICGLWLAGAAGVGQLLKMELLPLGDVSPNRSRWVTGVAAVAGVSLVLAASTGRLSLPPLAWQARTQWQPLAEQIVAAVSARAGRARKDPNEALVFVYGEPGLFFHLNARGSHAYIPAGGLGFVETLESRLPLFLVAGPHADRTPSFGEEFARVQTRMKLVAEYEYGPSDLVLLNQYDPRELKRNRDITQSVRLYEVMLDQ